MRRMLRNVGLALAVLVSGSVALAQDATSEQAWRFEARALDMTKMLMSGRSGMSKQVPLAGVQMDVTFDAPGSGDVTMSATTDDTGRFVLTGAEPAPGSTLTFWVAGKQLGEGKPGYFARPVHLSDAAPPDTVEFYEVSLDASDIVLSQVIHVVTAINRDFENDDGEKEIMFRNTAMLENRGPRVWLGDPRREDGVTYGVPTPAGFELRNATVDSQRVPTTTGTVGHGGATGYVYRGPIFPSVERGMVFQLMYAAPYSPDQEYDVSWHTEYFVGRYVVNFQEDAFTYLPPESGQGLSDGGVNPPMGNLKVITHMWGLAEVPPHGNLAVRFIAGRPFPMGPVLWTSAILLMVAGATVLGVAAARSGRKKTDEVATAEKTKVRVPDSEEGRDRELDLLDRRLRRGEITSIEHEIRKKAIANARAAESTGQAASPAKSTKQRKAPRPTATATGLLADVAQIAERADDADEAQLRADVRTLAAALKELLERR